MKKSIYERPEFSAFCVVLSSPLMAASSQVEGSTIDSWTDGNEDWFTM